MGIFMIWIINGIILFRDRFVLSASGIGENNLDKAGYEFEYRRKLEDELLKYILDEYRCTYSDFNEFIKKKGMI